MEKKQSKWGVTIAAAALLILAAANLFSFTQVTGLRRYLKEANDRLNSAVEGFSQKTSGMREELQSSIDRAKEELQSSIEREESMLAECKVEVGQYNSVANTVHITFRATPKEYKEGTALFFMYTCDKQASVTTAGQRDSNGVYQLEADVPLCETMNVKVVVSSGGTVYTETAEEALEVRKKVFLPLGNT